MRLRLCVLGAATSLWDTFELMILSVTPVTACHHAVYLISFQSDLTTCKSFAKSVQACTYNHGHGNDSTL